MNKQINIANIYILLWCLYTIQGVLFASGTILTQALLLLILVISIFYAVYCYNHYKLPRFFTGLSLLLFIFTIYGVTLIMKGERLEMTEINPIVVNNYTYLKSIYMSLLPIFPFYAFTRKGLITEKTLQVSIFIFLVVTTVAFFYKERLALMILINATESTNNIAYSFVYLIPFAPLFNKHPYVQYAILAYCMIFLLMGVKRGAIIIGIMCFLVIFLSLAANARNSRQFRYIFLSVILLVFAFYAFDYFLATSDYFNNRLAITLEGSSSNRDNLFSFFSNYFLYETDDFEFLFGGGANATLKIRGQYAHNDWLEIAINQGLLGLFAYAFFWITFFKTWRKTKSDKNLYLIMGLILLITFVKTMFSMSYNDYDFYLTLMLGYCLAQVSLISLQPSSKSHNIYIQSVR